MPRERLTRALTILADRLDRDGNRAGSDTVRNAAQALQRAAFGELDRPRCDRNCGHPDCKDRCQLEQAVTDTLTRREKEGLDADLRP